MKTLPPALQAQLDSGATTLCWCWRITRRDGVSLGFTDHDRDLTFDATVFERASGFTASEIRDEVGLAVDNLEVEGALASTRLDETQLAAGLFDDARVEILRVNWQDPTQRVLMRSGSLGEVRRAGQAFAAEIRGLAHYLQQPKGRLYQFTCDADLGDARCGIDLTLPQWRATVSVATPLSDRAFTSLGLAAFAGDWLTRGLVTFTTGANAGGAVEVKRHTLAAGVATIELWQPMAQPISAGDQFTVTAGCDKSIATCREKFANAINFRGFPHIPGNDFLAVIARPGDPRNDGSPLA